MEAPVFKKVIPPAYQADFDLLGRVASKANPTVSNEQAYNAVYSSHKNWYDEKKYKVIDTNFNKMENSLLNEFEATLEKGLDKKNSGNLKHAENFDKDQFDVNNIGFKNVPNVNSQLIKGDTYNPSLTKVTTSDPYNEIFGNKLH